MDNEPWRERTLALRSGRLSLTASYDPEAAAQNPSAFKTWKMQMQATLDERARNTVWLTSRSGIEVALEWERHPYIPYVWVLGYKEFAGGLYCWYKPNMRIRDDVIPDQIGVIAGQWQVVDWPTTLHQQPTDKMVVGLSEWDTPRGWAAFFSQEPFWGHPSPINPRHDSIKDAKEWCEECWRDCFLRQD